jgi:GAF domain-containing protein
MQRRGGSGQRISRPKARQAPTASVSTDPSAEQFERLKRERDEALAQLAATSDVLQIISRSPGKLEPVFQAMLDNALRICEAKFGTLYLCDGGVLRPVADTQRAPPAYIEARKHKPRLVPVPDGPVGGALITKQVVHVADLSKLQSYLEHHPTVVDAVELGGFRTALGVPMLRDTELIGVINIMRQEVRPFTDKQIKLVENFAAQAVIALENTRLLNELRESLQQQTATADVLKVISRSTFDLHTVLQTLVESAARLCDADRANITREKNGAFYRAETFGFSREFMDYVKDIPIKAERGSASGRALLEARVVHIPDVQADPEYTFVQAQRLGDFRTVLAVPMLREGVPIGVLILTREEVRPFTDKQIELLETFADQAVIAIENVRLFEAEHQRTRELSESLEQQTATSEVLKVISSSPGELEPVFQAMLENAAKLCGATYGTMYLHEGDRFRAAARQGHSPSIATQDWWTGEYFKPPSDVPLARCARIRAPVHVADMRQELAYLDDESWKVSVDAAGLRSVVVVPMVKERELLGAIAIYRTEVRPFTDKQIELVQNFAAQAVIAIENTRLLNELRESLQQQTATADVLKVISRSTFDLQTVLDTLVESAARLCGAEMANIWRPKDGAYRLTASYGVTARYKEYLENKEFLNTVAIEPGRGTMVGRVLLEGKTVHMHDIQADPDYKLSGLVALGGYRTMLGVPMLREGDPIGVLVLVQSTVRPFTDKQIELATTFADQAVIAIENVRLFDEVQARTRELSESLEQQTATSKVLQVISSSPGELEPVFQTMLANARRICEAAFGSMLLYEGELFRRVATHNPPPMFAEFHKNTPILDPRKIPDLKLIVETKRPVHVVDAAAVSPDTPIVKYAGARSLLVVPLLKDGELLGAIGIYRQEVRPFTDKQIELVQNFAAQAVIAIENTRLLNELRESLQQQTATADVLKVISRSTFDLQLVLDTLVESATRLCEAKDAFIFLRDGELYRVAARYGFSSQFQEYLGQHPRKAARGSITGRTALEGKVVHVHDVNSDPEYTWSEAQQLGGYRTVLGVPLLRDGSPVGVIIVARAVVQPFTEKQIELVTTFADQAVIAIENVRLFEDVQKRTRELSESLQQQTATADVLKIISRSAFDLRTVLQTLIESAARFCDADQATILRERDGAFYRTEAYGFSRDFMDYAKDIPIRADRGSASGRALLEGRVVHITDVTADPEYTLLEAQRLGDYRTILCVPMLRESIPIGVLILTRSEVRPFTEKQIDLVTTFADQAAIAIENVRLFESVEARTRELTKSLEDLRATQDRLVQTQKLASLGQLTAGIAHEIKNPLNFVNNFSGVSGELIDELQDALKGLTIDQKARAEIDELADTLRGNLYKVVQHGKRADAIVKNMLLHSRESSGEHRVVDINSLVEESLNLAWHGARAEKQGFNITMERSLDPAAGQADVFPQDVTRVLLNLISNGFYAATKRRAEADGDGYEPTLVASTRSLGDRVEIRVRDNGTGIAPEVKEKMFNPFFTTKPAGEGTGLGLSICHDIIVKQHGGSIEVDTKPGEFTEIRVTLPRVAALLS